MKIHEKDSSGLIIGIMDNANMSYDIKNINNNSIAISGKGFKYKQNVKEINAQIVKQNDKLIILQNEHNKSVEFQVNGILIGTGELNMALKQRFFVSM